jgi:hypothetical protein
MAPKLKEGHLSPQSKSNSYNLLPSSYFSLVTTFKGAQVCNLQSLGFSRFFQHKVSMGRGGGQFVVKKKKIIFRGSLRAAKFLHVYSV